MNKSVMRSPIISICPSKSILLWDGSFLQDSVYVLNEIKIGTNVYWEVYIKNCKYICLRRMIRDKLPLIADQIKPLFGLIRLGSHQLRCKGRIYMILKVAGPEVLCIPPTLALFIKYNPSYKEDPIFVERVRRAIAYRMILGMTKNHDRSIIVYNINGEYHPTSLTDTFAYDEIKKGDGSVDQATLTKWFETNDLGKVAEKCPNQIISEMFGLYIGDKQKDRMPLLPVIPKKIITMKDALSYLYDPVIDTINRFDKDLIWLYSDIVMFINGRASP